MNFNKTLPMKHGYIAIANYIGNRLKYIIDDVKIKTYNESLPPGEGDNSPYLWSFAQVTKLH